MRQSLIRGVIFALCLALWPALAVAAEPQPIGPLVYTDDFSDPAKSGLEDNVNATDYSRGFHAPGVYHLKLLKGDDTRWSLFPNRSYGQFTLEMDIWDNSDDFVGDVSQGVVIRALDPAHFYALLVDSRLGRYAVRKMDGDGSWTDLIAWKASPLIVQRDKINHVRVDAAGDSLTIYLNGEQLDAFKDASYARGTVGMIASNVDANQPHIHYDNVRIYSPEGTAAPMPGTGQVGAGHTQPVLPDPASAAGLALILLLAGFLTRRIGEQRVRYWE